MDVGSVYGSYYETAKSYMGLRKEEKQAGFAEKVTHKSHNSDCGRDWKMLFLS